MRITFNATEISPNYLFSRFYDFSLMQCL